MSYNWSEVFVGVGEGRTRRELLRRRRRRAGAGSRSCATGWPRAARPCSSSSPRSCSTASTRTCGRRIEEALIFADVGVDTTVSIVEALEAEAERRRHQGLGRAAGEAARAGGGPLLPGRHAHRRGPLARGDPDGGRERHGQDHHHRQDRLAPEGAGQGAAAGGGRHLPGGGHGAVGGVGPARGLRGGAPRAGRRPGGGGVRRHRGGRRPGKPTW